MSHEQQEELVALADAGGRREVAEFDAPIEVERYAAAIRDKLVEVSYSGGMGGALAEVRMTRRGWAAVGRPKTGIFAKLLAHCRI